MAPLTQIVQGLNRIVGTSARVTLGQKQLLEIARKKCPDVAEELAGILSKYPKAKATVAYKASERGFTVGAIQLKNGNKVIGNGAASISNVGTENTVMKLRYSFGENGKALRAGGHLDFSKNNTLQDMNIGFNLKNGVIDYTAANNNGRGYFVADIPEITRALGVEAEATGLTKVFNELLADSGNLIRNVASGKVESRNFGDEFKALGKKCSKKGKDWIEEIGKKYAKKDPIS